MAKTPEEDDEERRRRSSIAPGAGSGEKEPAGRESEVRKAEDSQGYNQKKGGSNFLYWGAVMVVACMPAVGLFAAGIMIGAKFDDISADVKFGVVALSVVFPGLGIGMAIGYGGKKLYEKMSSQKTESPALLEGIHRAKKKPGLGEGREVPLNPEVAREVEKMKDSLSNRDGITYNSNPIRLCKSRFSDIFIRSGNENHR